MNKAPVVHHNTRVTLKLPPAWKSEQPIVRKASVDREKILAQGEEFRLRSERVVAMMDFLAGLGFRLSSGTNCVYADSTEIEAGDIKKRLIAAGFRDWEFQIVLEYTRKWGMM